MGRRVAEKPRRRRRRLVLAIVIPVVVLVLGGFGAWIVVRGLAAQQILEEAVPLTREIQDAIVDGEGPAAREQALALADRTAEAVELTGDPVWRVAEFVPLLGGNLTAVRVAVEVTDSLAVDVVLPATDFDVDSVKPVDGRIDIDAIEAASGFVATVGAHVNAAIDRLDEATQGPLLPPVQSGIDRLDKALDQVAQITDVATPAFELLPGMLGGDGPRTYLFLFQNNAESRGTGGNPASVALITADDGRIGITTQAGSTDFRDAGDAGIIPVDEETAALYGSYGLTRLIQQVSLTPDFPTTAQIASAFWADSYGTTVDAVVSFDPIGLRRLLKATGSVTLPTGEKLTDENAVDLLLNEVYFRYPETEQQDAFFAAAAATVFSAVTSGTAETRPLIDALSKAVDNGDLMLWSSHADEQALLEPLPISGRLEPDSADETTLAVYFNDTTPNGSKMDYYLESAVTADVATCGTDGFAATVHVQATNLLEPSAVAGLPKYISVREDGVLWTDLMIYGPVGTQFTDLVVDSVATEPLFVGQHLGRPVVVGRFVLAPGKTSSLSAGFTGPGADYGPIRIDGTPMVHATERVVAGADCG